MMYVTNFGIINKKMLEFLVSQGRKVIVSSLVLPAPKKKEKDLAA